MKNFFLKQLKKILKSLARATIKKYQPGIIALTGSVGKTSTKLAVYAVLSGVRKVRMSPANFNNEIGVPLAILGDWEKIRGYFFWLRVILKSIIRIIFRFDYPEILILEYAVDRPGDMKYLIDIARPQIGVFTALGDVPVHVEFFQNPEAILKEKSRLIESLPSNGFAILNADDNHVLMTKDKTNAHVLTYGFLAQAEVRITNFEYRYDGGKPNGVFFKINYSGTFVPVKISGIFSKAQVYSCAAAATVGLAFGLNLVKISENLERFQAYEGRMQMFSGLNGSYVLDDSYNAAPASMWNALNTLKNLKGRRRVAILGDMLEIGSYSIPVHGAVGKEVAKFVDLLITVGPRGRFIGDAAKKSGLSLKKIFTFNNVNEAIEKVPSMIQEDDLVLIKASHSIGLDKLVREIKKI